MRAALAVVIMLFVSFTLGFLVAFWWREREAVKAYSDGFRAGAASEHTPPGCGRGRYGELVVTPLSTTCDSTPGDIVNQPEGATR